MAGGGHGGGGGGGGGSWLGYVVVGFLAVLAICYAIGSIPSLLKGEGLAPILPASASAATNPPGSRDGGFRPLANYGNTSPSPARRRAQSAPERRYAGHERHYAGTQHVFMGSDRVFTGTTREYRGTETVWKCDIAVNRRTGERRVIDGKC